MLHTANELEQETDRKNEQMNERMSDTVSDKTCHQFKDSKLRMSVHYYNMYTYKHNTHYTMTWYSKVTTQFTVYYTEFKLFSIARKSTKIYPLLHNSPKIIKIQTIQLHDNVVF